MDKCGQMTEEQNRDNFSSKQNNVHFWKNKEKFKIKLILFFIIGL